MSDLCDFDHDSALDVPEHLGGGIVWWTRHTRSADPDASHRAMNSWTVFPMGRGGSHGVRAR